MKNLQQKYENLIICYLGAEEVFRCFNLKIKATPSNRNALFFRMLWFNFLMFYSKFSRLVKPLRYFLFLNSKRRYFC